MRQSYRFPVKFCRREIGEIVRYLPDKKKQNFAWFSSCRYCADRAQNLPPGPAPTTYSEFSRFHPNRLTLSGVIAERMNTAKMRRKVNPIIRLKHSFEPNKNCPLNSGTLTVDKTRGRVQNEEYRSRPNEAKCPTDVSGVGLIIGLTVKLMRN